METAFYDTIIKAARHCLDGCPCNECPMPHGSGDTLVCNRVFTQVVACLETSEEKKCHEKAEEESVDHPSHYQGEHECIEIMSAMFGDENVAGFCRCNSFKYRFRAGKKDGSEYEEDIKKAEWYEKYLMMLTQERHIIE